VGPRQQRAYAGKHYQLQETLCSPQPIHRPSVLIGGGGERKTLRLVAQYGDACNLFATSPDDVAHKLGVLRRHCDDLGRDYETIRRTVTVHDPQPTQDTRDEFVRAMSEYAKLGIDTAIVMPSDGAPAKWFDSVAPAVKHLAEL
jgi:alkanesulfonate monooxygenase SsuD/methylene tetrahydromethanopterin reductase-like flavin-dependent oxidoreductase (luciferase family)